MILICGIPNAGKTTYSKQYEGCIHFDRIHGTNKKMRERVLEMVEADPDAVVEGVYYKADDRRRLAEAGHGGMVIWLDTPVEECCQRERTYRKRPEMIVRSCAKHFEPPTFDEGWHEIVIIRGSNEQRYSR